LHDPRIAGRGDRAERRCADGGVRRQERRGVGGIEDFAAQLKRPGAAERHPAHQRQVQVAVAGSADEGGHHRISAAEVERLLARQRPDDRRRPAPEDPDESLDGLSARNRLHGFIDEVRIDGLLAQVRLRVGDQSLTAVITADAVRALRLRRGDDALAIVKSTEVMIARPGGQRPAARRRRK